MSAIRALQENAKHLDRAIVRNEERIASLKFETDQLKSEQVRLVEEKNSCLTAVEILKERA